jgi:prepilin-type N-terminal cleavage/methylation domain-containing protein
MRNNNTGFSLIELLMALLIVGAIGSMTFQLFRQNERVIRDQTLIMEMQQTARVVLSQIADEVRQAGQGVPVYAATFDLSPSEATTPFLGTSTSSRIDFRAGLSNTESSVTTVAPIDITMGASGTLGITDTAGLATGKFIYIWGPSTNGWTWVRAQLTSVTSTTVTFTASQTGSQSTVVRFTTPPTVYLEEAVSIYLNAGSVRRATATSFTNPAAPTWSAANEIGNNVTALTFTYYDASDSVITPTSLSNRASVARIDILLTVQASGPLSDGTIPTYSLTLRTIPRNVRIRSAN